MSTRLRDDNITIAYAHSDTPTWGVTIASVGLFLVTTAVTQYARALADRCRNGSLGEAKCSQVEELQNWYRRRRGRDRLSYGNLCEYLKLKDDPSTKSGQSDTHSQDEPLTALRPTEWEIHQHRRPRSASTSEPQYVDLSKERRDSVLGELHHPNADYDFHPKNRNWRHFEHFNATDTRRSSQAYRESATSVRTIPTADSRAVNRMAAFMMNGTPEETEESSEDGDFLNDSISLSTDHSESSEEQFVWMKHSHRPSQHHRTNGEENSWAVALHRRFPNPLTNIFVDGDHSQANNEAASAVANKDYRRSSSCLFTDPSKNSSNKKEMRRHHSTLTADMAKSKATQSQPKSTGLVGRIWGGDNGDLAKKRLSRSASQPIALPTSLSEDPHQNMRAQYNAQIMPEKVILIRHGQSMGNINEALYSTTPDNAMPLTQLGWEQARAAGKVLKQKMLASGESIHFIVSPYVRTVETFHGIVSAWCDPKEFSHITNKEKRVKAWYGRLIEMGLTWNEDSRIREQDFGNYQDPETIKRAKRERHRFGVFYYRFPHGESASDVFDRVSTFLDSLWRSFEMNKSRNYVLVTHGISIRVLLARYFRYTIDQFNILANPRNCEMVVLGHNGDGRLDMQGRCNLDLETNEETGENKVSGYQFHKRLRILPKQAIRKVKIRISPDE